MRKREREGYLRLNELIKLEKAREVRRRAQRWVGWPVLELPIIYGRHQQEEWLKRLKEQLYSEDF